MKKLITLIIIITVVSLAYLALRDGTETHVDTQSGISTSTADMIHVARPSSNTVVGNPLEVVGEARGNWYFEASFPVRILDASGKELGVVPAQAQGEWMTTEFVPFRATLNFSTPSTDTGTLVLERDNPSGLPQYADEIRIPIRFR